jgi:hypothetical protein
MSFVSSGLDFLDMACLPSRMRFLLFFSSHFFAPSTPASTRYPVRSRTDFSSLPSDGDIPVSLPPPISAEPAFPARGMLAQFPHAFAGGALLAFAASSGPVILIRGRSGAIDALPPIRKRNSRGADVTRGAQWGLPLRDGGRSARVNVF